MSARRLSPLIINELRAYLDIERKEVADDLGISIEDYADLEGGLKAPTQEQLLRMASMFNCKPETLYGNL